MYVNVYKWVFKHDCTRVRSVWCTHTHTHTHGESGGSITAGQGTARHGHLRERGHVQAYRSVCTRYHGCQKLQAPGGTTLNNSLGHLPAMY